MKKFTFLLVTLCLLMTICVSAKSGDIAGKYYSTDIVTTLNGVEIDAINIGGQTLISAEDMYYYSFTVRWDANERTLRVNSIKHAENGIPPEVKKSSKPSGSVLGYYYETDIVTYLDNKPITAYNIGGRTYIHAEQMRDFGYEVIWNADERSLAITSPDRAGNTYSISLSRGVEGTERGVGAFSITYTKNGVIATDDANCFGMSMSCGETYNFSMSFYQNYRPTDLHSKLMKVACYQYESGFECDPSEKYDEVNELLKISINGHEAKQIAVRSGAGNGHVDFSITVSGLPKYKADEIEEIRISIGEVQGEPYEMLFPKDEETAEKEELLGKLLKNPYDFIKYTYSTDDYYIVHMRESKQLGAVKDRIYVVNRKTGECSEDILEQVRALDGFNYDTFSIYAVRMTDENQYFRFSLFFKDKTADFNMRIDKAYVELLAQSPR
ncbi:MAG: hypothetical protein IJ002_06090 [Clostridia bacterium]|nr:hypothetical protein [Clostridia bacterium]